MATEGRVTGGLSPGEQIRTFELSTQASDEGAPSTKNVQAVAIADATTAGRVGVVDSAGNVIVAVGNRTTYSCGTGTITGATATGTKTLAYLWHPASVTTLRYDLLTATVSQNGAGVGGTQRLELRRITAENATPGGTTGTILPHNTASAASGATVRIAPTGAPTISTGNFGQVDVPTAVLGSASFPVHANGQTLEDAEAYVMRASQAEGYVITQEVLTTLTTAPTFTITFCWTEYAP